MICSPIWIFCGALDRSSAWRSVLTATQSIRSPSVPSIRSRALEPAPPTPSTLICTWRPSFESIDLPPCTRDGDGRPETLPHPLPQPVRGARQTAPPPEPGDPPSFLIRCPYRARPVPVAKTGLSSASEMPEIPAGLPIRTGRSKILAASSTAPSPSAPPPVSTTPAAIIRRSPDRSAWRLTSVRISVILLSITRARSRRPKRNASRPGDGGTSISSPPPRAPPPCCPMSPWPPQRA